MYNDSNTDFHGKGNDALNPALAASQLAPSLATQWKVMTYDEKVEATSGTVEELKVQQETNTLVVQNTRLSVFHDAHNNLNVIETEVCPSTAPSAIDLILVGQLRALYARTGMQVAMIAVKSNADQYGRPRVFITSERPTEFFNLSLKTNINDVTLRMEAYCLSGAQGMYMMHACS